MRTWWEVRNFAWHQVRQWPSSLLPLPKVKSYSGSGPFFHKFLTSGPGPKENCRILPESTPAIRIHVWPESLFQTPTPLQFQNFWIRARIRNQQFFKFDHPTPVQTPATIIHPTEIFPCFYWRKDHTDQRQAKSNFSDSNFSPAPCFKTPALTNFETSAPTPVNTPKTSKQLTFKRYCLFCFMWQNNIYVVAILPLIEHKRLKWSCD